MNVQRYLYVCGFFREVLLPVGRFLVSLLVDLVATLGSANKGLAGLLHVAVKTNHQPRLRTNGDGHPHIAYKIQWPTGPVIFTDQSPAHPLLLR